MDIGQEVFVVCVVGEVPLDILPQGVLVSPQVQASWPRALTLPVGRAGQGQGEVSSLARHCWGKLDGQTILEYLTQLALAGSPSTYP